MNAIAKLIETNEVQIVSGQGDMGQVEIYNGKKTMRAIKMRLTKESFGGSCWAKAKVFSHSNDFCDVFIDVLTGEYC